MRKILITSIAVIASLNILAQGYRNPVLPGFHADPSVCTDGKDFIHRGDWRVHRQDAWLVCPG